MWNLYLLFRALGTSIAVAHTTFAAADTAGIRIQELYHESQESLSLPSLSAAAQSISSSKAITPELSKFVERLIKEEGVPGLALGVVRKDGEIELGAWGVRTEKGDPMTADTTFYLASCSKAFLSAAMGILMDDFAQGKNVTALPHSVDVFDWDTKVKDLLGEEWVLEDKWAQEKANVRDILSHVTGLYRHDLSYGPREDPKELIGKMRYLRPSFELRGQYSYNNQMYVLGTYIIATYANTSYRSFVHDRIFAPLDMVSTTYSAKEAEAWGHATQTWTPFGRRIPVWFSDENIDFNSGPGGVISCAKDLVKWVRMLLNSGVDPRTNTTIIPRSAFEEVTTAHVIGTGQPGSPQESIMGYGMGWIRGSYLGHDLVTHSGGIPGITTRVTFLPQEGDELGVIVLINADDKTFNAALPLTQKVQRNVLGLQDSSSDAGVIERKEIAMRQKSFSAPKSQPWNKEESWDKASWDVDLDLYAGTYTNPGYGGFTICSPISMSSYCHDVLGNFSIVDSSSTSSFEPGPGSLRKELYAAWPRLWSSHLRFVHKGEHRFILDATYLFTQGYGNDTSPFEVSADGDTGGVKVEFDVLEAGSMAPTVRGLGFMDLIKGRTGRTARDKGHSIKDKADVWFEKVV